MTETIREELFRLRDEKYRDFQIRLLPTVEPETVIGVRTPELRKLAKQLAKEPGISTFLDTLPHLYFDENQLHAFVLSGMKDFDRCVKEVDRFLPFVDNWATCDQLSPRVFKKHKEALLEQIRIWLRSERTYTIRFAIGMLMQHYLDEAFDPVYLEEVSIIRSEEYYVNMMIAWYLRPLWRSSTTWRSGIWKTAGWIPGRTTRRSRRRSKAIASPMNRKHT